MAARLNLVGRIFGRLTVHSFSSIKNGAAHWNCVCSCGEKIVVASGSLVKGLTKSCGCFRRELVIKENTTHGLKKHPAYKIWMNMHQRCYSEKDVSYRNYGGRGIEVCNLWHKENPKGLLNFVRWYEKQLPIPRGYTLDRENNDGNYYPKNCRFVSRSVQQSNRRAA